MTSRPALAQVPSSSARSLRVASGPDAWAGIDAQWTSLLRESSNGVEGCDATCSPVWARALAATWLRDAELHTAIVPAERGLAAVVPTYVRRDRGRPFDRRDLHLLTQAYGGRTGLLAGPDAAAIADVLAALVREIPGWDAFFLGVVRDSPGHRALLDAADALDLPRSTIGTNVSPYVELGDDWEALLARLPKKTRWTIRKGEKDLVAKGTLDYRPAAAPSDVPGLIEAMYEIERRSWKESSGTSITTQHAQREFYEALLPAAAAAGQLSGHVLRLDDRPLAYILGIDDGSGVFLDLKESFDAEFASLSPGHVLKRHAMDTLIRKGVRIYDFMGRCEPYKMRWTDRTYAVDTLVLFRNGLRGRLRHAQTRIGRWRAARRAAATEAPAAPTAAD